MTDPTEDMVRKEIVDAVRILRDDGVHVTKAFRKLSKLTADAEKPETPAEKPGEKTEEPTEGKPPPAREEKPGEPPAPKTEKRGVWWG